MYRWATQRLVAESTIESVKTALVRQFRRMGFRIMASGPGVLEVAESLGAWATQRGVVEADIALLRTGRGVNVASELRQRDVSLGVVGEPEIRVARLLAVQDMIDGALATLNVPVEVSAGPVSSHPTGTTVDAIATRLAASGFIANSYCERLSTARTSDIRFRTTSSFAAMPFQHASDILAVGRLLAGSPGGCEADIEAVARIALVLWEWCLISDPSITISLDRRGAQAIRLLEEQVGIRQVLPSRSLYVCMDCNMEKVVNPEYLRIAQRNRLIKAGATIGTSILAPGANLVTMGGRILSVKNFDPDYVCSRCQGLEADETPVILCRDCGFLCKSSLLTKCANPGCGSDFSAVARPRAWITDDFVASASDHSARAGWYPDGSYSDFLRWFDGESWSDWVSDGSSVSTEHG
jgi:hypothetical protein